MLVLTRRPGETICVGDDIKITVLNIKGVQVGMGFDAPNDVTVHREEIHQKIENARNTPNSREPLNRLEVE